MTIETGRAPRVSHTEHTEGERAAIKANVISILQGLEDHDEVAAQARRNLSSLICARLGVDDLDVELSDAITALEYEATRPVAAAAYHAIFRNLPDVYMSDDERPRGGR